MAATDLERLIVTIEANSTKLNNELRKLTGTVDTQLGRVEKRTAQMSSRVTAGFSKAGAAIGAFFTVRAIVGFISRVSEAADKLQALSDRTGVGADELQRLAGAAAKANIDTENLNDALDIFARNVGRAAEGQGDLAKIMNEFGISAGGGLVPTLLEVAAAVQKAKTRTEEYRITQAAFGKSSAELVGFLRQGPDEIKRLMDAFNSGLSADAVKRLADFNTHWKEISVSFTNMAAGPASSVLKGLSDFLSDLEQGTWLQRLQEFSSLLTFGIVPLPLITLEHNINDVAGALNTATAKVMELKAALDGARSVFDAARIKKDLGEAADEMVRLQGQLTALTKQRPPSAKKVADKPFGGGAGDAGGADTAASIAAREFRILQGSFDKLDKMRADAAQADDAFRQTQGEQALEDRRQGGENQRLAQEKIDEDLLREREDFDERMQAARDTAALNDAEARQKEIDAALEHAALLEQALQAGISDSLVDIGLAARHGFGALEDAARRALDRIIDMTIELQILKPILDAIQAGGGFGGGGVKSLFGFAQGGVMGPGGPVPLKRYAGGGIASHPQLAMFGEGSGNEAFVPLPDGRRIPVTLKMPNIPPGSARQSMNVVVRNEVSLTGANGDETIKRFADEGARKGASFAINAIKRAFPDMMVAAEKRKL